MAGTRDGKYGGVTIKVGNNTTFKSGDIAGGDIVDGDKNIQVVDVTALGAQLVALSAQVRAIRQAVEAASDVDEDERDAVVHALSGAGMELGAAGKEVRALPPGEPMPAALSTRIKDTLAILADAGKSAASLVTSANVLAHKLGPLISSIGSILG